jgi:predicted nucleotidyltransferase
MRTEVLADPAEVEPPRYARDRDVFHDKQGRVYVAMGHIQPRDRILSFLKYIPDSLGRWRMGDTRYRRLFQSGADNMTKVIRHVPPEFLRKDKHFRTTLVEVPKREVARYFMPEPRLQEIRDRGPQDVLETAALELSEVLNETLEIPLNRLGVAGSVLWKAHDPDQSDVNLNVYGLNESWKLSNGFFEVVRENERVDMKQLNEWALSMSRLFSMIPALTPADTRLLFSRKKLLLYNKRPIGVTPILLADEYPIFHESESYTPITSMPIRVTMDITDDKYGLFMPALYLGESEGIPLIEDEIVTRIMLYAGTFKGLIKTGDKVEVSGVLQRVTSERREFDPFYQMMVGTAGYERKEYIKIIKAGW